MPDRIEELETRVERLRVSRDGWTLGIFAFAAVALLVSVLGVGLGIRAVDEADEGGGGGGEVAAGGTEHLDVELGDLFVRPGSIEVAAGTEVVLAVTNSGSTQHDLKLNGETGTELVDPGGTAEASLGVVTESTQAWCTIPGHREAGMVLDITVTGSASGEQASAGGGSTDRGDRAVIDFSAETGPDFVPFDPNLAPAPGGTEHVLTMHASETVLEVAPGVTQEMWVFDGQFPGPVLRGRVGDLFTVTLVNDGQLGHSIDFHASRVAWNDEMRTIQPGESLTYQFVADYAGAWMYHCGTAPALHHIGNGMHGAIIIDPPDLPPVDHEFVFVQSELYLGPEGAPGDLTAMQQEDHDAVVFNGYVNQYRDHPIRVEPGERIRAWVVDAGPSENSSFHIVGTIFDTVFKEGAYNLRPDGSRGGSQALDLQPAQGGFVEFSFAEPGLYPIVTHKFANVGIGALGLFQAGDVEATEGSAEH